MVSCKRNCRYSALEFLYIVIFLFAAVLLYCCTFIGISDLYQGVIAIFVLYVGTVFVITYVNKKVSDEYIRIIIITGYYLRIAIMLIDLFLNDKVTIPLAGADDGSFWYRANLFYDGEHPSYYTRYSLYLSKAMHVFGSNRFVAQYINIFAWFITAMILLYFARRLSLSYNNARLVSAVIAFMPVNVFLTSILMRESIMIMFDTISFVLFIAWMKSGKKKALLGAFIILIPAILLHNSSVALWVGYVLMLLFWEGRRQRFRIRLASVGLLVVIGAVAWSIYRIPVLNTLFLGRFHLNNISLYTITHLPQEYGEGDSTYLHEMDCQNWFQFIIFTVIRMSYFCFSPMPGDWRGSKDIITFVMDSIPIFVLLVSCLRCKNKAFRPYILAGLLSYTMMVGIFAWGTMTAGTAMRHRGQLLSILLLTYCFARAEDSFKWRSGDKYRKETRIWKVNRSHMSNM